jgi:ATP-dependent DNA ligase
LKSLGGKTQTALIDVDRFEGKDMTKAPFEEKRKVLEAIAKRDPDFMLPELAKTTVQKKKLWQRIKAGKHPQTKEGVILHNYLTSGVPFKKAKIFNEHDVYVSDIYLEEGVKPGRKPMAAGIKYSWTPGGESVGHVGTGFTHEEKEDMMKNPDKYVGKVARVHALGMSKNKALLKPAFKHWHVEKNIEPENWAKQSVIVNKELASSRGKATSIAKGFTDRLYTSRETGQSYRFRQAPPEKFERGSFRTFSPKPGISIIYGKLK